MKKQEHVEFIMQVYKYMIAYNNLDMNLDAKSSLDSFDAECKNLDTVIERLSKKYPKENFYNIVNMFTSLNNLYVNKWNNQEGEGK